MNSTPAPNLRPSSGPRVARSQDASGLFGTVRNAGKYMSRSIREPGAPWTGFAWSRWQKSHRVSSFSERGGRPNIPLHQTDPPSRLGYFHGSPAGRLVSYPDYEAVGESRPFATFSNPFSSRNRERR